MMMIVCREREKAKEQELVITVIRRPSGYWYPFPATSPKIGGVSKRTCGDKAGVHQ